MRDDQGQAESEGQTRRSVLAVAGAVGASLTLSSCGGDAADRAGSGGARPDSDAAVGHAGRQGGPVARTSDIPVGGGRIFIPQNVVITQPRPGVFKGFDPICTHQGCPVSQVEDGAIICTCHDARFSIEDGSVKRGPTRLPLAARDITVEGGDIFLA